MSITRLLILFVSLVLFLVIIRKFISSWFTGPSREEQLRGLDAEEKRKRLIKPGVDSPVCPRCGGMTELYQYPHIKVWRCIEYPDCRGFVKIIKPPRPKFVTDWERNRRKSSGK